jgi:prolyl-tRNA synthetase
METACTLYKTLNEAQIDCLLDDRAVSPGFKFKDADLLGMPLQVVIGKQWTDNRKIEFKERKTGEQSYSSMDDFLQTTQSILNRL